MSRSIANLLADDSYFAATSTLSDYETLAAPPRHIQKVITLCVLYSIDFQTQDSITLLAVVLMGGVFSMWGAVIAAILMQFFPQLLQNIGVNSDWLIILFGVGVLQVLATAPAGIVDQLPKDLARLYRLIVRGRRRAAASGGTG